MTSQRIQRRIEALLDEADEAVARKDWATAIELANDALTLDSTNTDAFALLSMAERRAALEGQRPSLPHPSPTAATAQPTSFAGGRYEVRRFLGEGGKKRVFLAHDTRLDRDVAFALIKTEGLDEVGRERIAREAQAMGRLGAHPHIVTIFEIGEEAGSPFVVNELLAGGDVEGELEKAGGALPLARALEIAKGVARGLAFAHERGIVHRDLKPGNVWLTAEGVAKIGDFGLAVSLDRSRLTQHGMMVGTVAYMPPEQALGGEVTPQADLYSLGAMLYELVTGRPPFQADDPTAVVSQHINTPPVAPSWHSERCPPDLETLILRLLSKAPQDRPKSASEVLAALEAVDPDARSASHSESSANPLDRLARGVFVGRERELERLRAAFDDAFGGRGSVVMLVGEPGIGKTRTVQELATYARMRGAKVLWGRAHEASGAPAYWPWVQAARDYRAQTPDDVRRRQYEPYAVDLQRIFNGLRDLFPGLPDPPPVDSEEGQFRLFDALTSFLRDVTVETPLVVVLDDLHWADRSTLRMLTHLAREIGVARLLVVGTYRDTDLDRQHPLSQALAEMNREQLFTRVLLRGLAEAETRAYIEASAHVAPSADLVRRIHQETEGNPFFLSEVVRLMAEEGSLAKDSLSNISIPEGVKEALGRRLDRLSPEANELLSVAAVVGRECSHQLLAALTDFDDDALLRLVEEALAARVLEETGVPGEYRFTHALMQDALYAELSTARRVRMHARVAETLESLYGENLDGRGAELARHFGEAAVMNTGLAGKAVRYSQLAAEQAVSSLAYPEAAAHYKRCLDLVRAAPTELNADEASLWRELAVCQMRTGELRRAWDSCERALDAATDKAPERVAILARVMSHAITPHVREHRERLEHELALMEGEATVEACQLLALIADCDPTASGDAAATAAMEMASELGLTGTEYPQLLEIRPALSAIERGEFSKAIFASEQAEAVAGGSWTIEQRVLLTRTFATMLAGDIARLVPTMELLIARSAAFGDRGPEKTWGAALRRIGWLRGEVLEQHQPAETHPGAPPYPQEAAARQALERGDPALALELMPSVDDAMPYGAQGAAAEGVRAVILLALGDVDRARHSLEYAVVQALTESNPMQTRCQAISAVGDALCPLADERTLVTIAEFLAAYPDLRYWTLFGRSPDHLRGEISLHLGRTEEAEDHFRTGLEWASRPDVGFLLDQGHCHHGLAEVAERRGDVEALRAHLDAAGHLYSALGAKLYLDQVLAKKQLLKA